MWFIGFWLSKVYYIAESSQINADVKLSLKSLFESSFIINSPDRSASASNNSLV